ncbi:MAG: cupin-like domain-containing protein [Pseudomonadota bacterium]
MSPVPEYHGIDRARFEAEIVPPARPAILRGLVAGWPAVQAGRDSAEAFAAYLRSQANDTAAEAWFGPPEIAGRFDFTPEIDGYNHDRKLATVDQMLDLLLRQRGTPEPWGIYAGALPLGRHLPGFAAANPMPLLDPERYMLTSLWLGNRTQTAAHWDVPQNLACVVLGRRRFTLFPPGQLPNLYVGPIDFTLAGQPTSLVDIDAPDFERFPRFARALEAAEVAELEPGDALYLPSLWWHGVRGQDEVGAMVNYWWRDGPAHMVTPMQSLLHAAMTMHELPEAERAAWKAHFDHYIFHANGDPLPHVPQAARGILGARTPELIARLKARLAKGLGK